MEGPSSAALNESRAHSQKLADLALLCHGILGSTGLPACSCRQPAGNIFRTRDAEDDSFSRSRQAAETHRMAACAPQNLARGRSLIPSYHSLGNQGLGRGGGVGRALGVGCCLGVGVGGGVGVGVAVGVVVGVGVGVAVGVGVGVGPPDGETRT